MRQSKWKVGKGMRRRDRHSAGGQSQRPWKRFESPKTDMVRNLECHSWLRLSIFSYFRVGGYVPAF